VPSIAAPSKTVPILESSAVAGKYRVLLFVLFCAEIEDVVGYGTSPAMENDNPTAWRFDFKFFINISRTTTDKDRAALGAQAQKGQ